MTDHIPYESKPFAYTQPAALAANAALLGWGVSAPPPDRARVLELGAASGGNIIPLAARFPDGHFVAIDLSPAEIELGRARAATLGLANLSLDARDILDIPETGEPFDYISRLRLARFQSSRRQCRIPNSG